MAEFSRQDIEKIIQEMVAADNKAADSLRGYSEVLQKVLNQKKLILEVDKKINEDEKRIKEIINQLENKKIKLSDDIRKKLEDEKKALINNVKQHKLVLSHLKQQNEELAKSINNANLLSASLRSAGKATKKLGEDFLTLQGHWGEIMPQQKEIQRTEKAMGVLSSQAQGFRVNIQKAALSTNQLGVNSGDLAKMQGAYSEQVGRSVQLSERGLEAMAELASGTMLGADGAAEMAANMENFGISVEGTRDRVEDMMNLASKMGVNSVKVTKNLVTNMKLANKFHFKDGVKGMIRLAAEAAKMRLDMEGIAGMADKVFRPEGAVEMAARLQTMGGEFAKLADPFQLMFKARNDFEGFAEDIGNATKEFAKFNAETGEFEISGLGYDRIKEIADITGISAESLAEMGRNAAKLEEIEMNTNLNDENSAFVSSIATFNETTKQWEVNIAGQQKNIKLLQDNEIDRIRKEKENLKERAKQAQTFDETWKNLKNTLKTLLLPILDGLSEGLKEPLNDFMIWAKETDLFKNIFDSAKEIGQKLGEFLKSAGKLANTIVKFVAENPIKSLIGALSGMGLFKAFQWYMNGRYLGMGFNSIASAGGNGGGIGGLFGGKGDILGLTGKNNPFRNAKAGWLKAGRAGKAGKNLGSKMVGGMKGFTSGMKGFKGGGLAIAGTLASMGIDYWRNTLDDPNSGAGKAMGIGSNALQGAGIGAMFGPWGALIGGILGAGYGAFKEYAFEDKKGRMSKYDDVIIRSGQAPVAINPADDIMSVKKDGPVDKALGNASKSGAGGGGSMNITFSPITISGKLELTGEGAKGELDMSNPIFMRDLSKVIQEEVRKAIGGGKINPNPA